ncbi:MAG TPA: FtsX-like permease family protein [Solirubrobacteraceae bacterium]|jgi:putative ABC transport system permease protein|nr:FtsX-like permease family protein [Solirubrobacteraceae bacterium]
MLFHLYRRRLRSHLAQEMLAGSGIAVGVALVLGVLVANTSLTGSAGALIHQVIGSARLELTSRSSAGFEQRLASTVERLPGVRSSAAILRENVSVVGRKGRGAVQMLGVTSGANSLGSLDIKNFGASGFRFSEGLILPASVASAIGAEPGSRVTLLAAGIAHRVRVGAVLSGALFGALSSSPVAITLLPIAQRLVGLPGQVTQVLVQPHPGADRRVAGELRRIVGGRLDVTPADKELRLLDQAIKPNSQSTELFSAISVMVGFLLAVNAMLLTVPERRRLVADLRMQGYDRRQVLLLLSFQALALGVVASLIGVALGDVLSSAFFHRVPTYLEAAFPIGAEQIVHTTTLLAAFGCGVIATMLASLTPALDLRDGRAVDAVFREPGGRGEIIGGRATRVLVMAGVASIVVVTALVLIAPSTTIVGGVALALSTLLLIPAMFAGIAHALPWMGDHVRSSALVVAVSELRATSMRAVALAGIAGLAVYGGIAIGGARGDLIRGIDHATAQYFGTADIWVGTGQDIFNVNRFEPRRTAAAIARAPGVASVRSYQGGLLDVRSRRLWIRARPPGDSAMVEASQLLHGNLERTTQLLRQGGWAAVSSAFAGERHLHVGDAFSLPTPSGTAIFRTAAIVTNSGWPPGTITLNTNDYSRYWQTADPSAFEVSLLPGVSNSAGKRSVQAALANRRGLSVLTSGERTVEAQASARQGLETLGEISTLLLIAAGLAIAAALSAAVWQRRSRLASLKVQGYDSGQLWRALLLESVITVGVGCTVGAAVGVYGHALAGRWLKLTTGFPAPFAVAPTQMALTLALITVVALTVIAIPGLAAARVPARVSFQD